MRRCVANDWVTCVRFARGARTELDHDLRAHQTGLLEQRLEADEKAVPVNPECCGEPSAPEPGLDDRVRLIPNPLGQAGADRVQRFSWLRVGGNASSPAPETRSGATARMS